MKRGFLVAAAQVLLGSALAQSVNVDMDIFFGGAESGHGIPSDAFGGAANQPGRWNSVGLTERGPKALLGLDGGPSGVVFTLDSVTVPGGIGYPNLSNTGDIALLLNDAAVIGPTGTGGFARYQFGGLSAGWYEIYTYAVHPAPGYAEDVPVVVPGSVNAETQIVGGPMPGNTFEEHVTHSVHRIFVNGSDSIFVEITQPPDRPQGYAFMVNGFQIVAVPEPSTWLLLSAGVLAVARRLRPRRSGLS